MNQDYKKPLLRQRLFHGGDAPRILVIRFARLGDVLLLVPTLKALRHNLPQSRISVLVGRRCAPILDLCSAVDEVLTVDRLAMRDGSKLVAIRDIFRLAEKIRRERFDLALDLHSFRETNLLAWYSRARWRIGLKRASAPFLSFCFNVEPIVEDKSLHVSAVFLSSIEALGLERKDVDFRLDLSAADLQFGKHHLQQCGLNRAVQWVGMNVGAGSPGRMWASERFCELASRLIREQSVNVVLFSGPQEAQFARDIEARIDQPSRVMTASQLSLRELASVVSQCRLLVSNDTGPMHLGPATGVPTLGLFSLGHPEHYRPMGASDCMIQEASIQDISVDRVYRCAVKMLGLI